MLPLKDYMLGTEHIEEKCTIHVNKKRGTFELRNGNLSAKSKIFQIDRDFNQFQGMERDREHPVFALRSTYDKTAGVKKSARFVPGDKGQKGQLCVRFDKGHPKWHGNSFDNTLAWFKANIKDSSIVRHDTALWNAACAPDSDPVDIDTAPENWSPPPVESVSASTSRKSKPGQQNTGLLHANGKIKSSSVVVYEPTPESISAPRRSTRHSDAPPKPPEEEPDELILVYPWGTTGGVNLSKSDLNRLKPGEYLNDNLIELGLKMWHSRLEKENPELANEIYVFSSFFYKKLSVKNADEGYNAVRRWTSKTNIFAKKYIIVPINENFHWYLAIIYQPEHILLPPLQITSPATRGRTRQSIVTPASPSADPLREISPETTLDDSPVSAHVFSSEAQEAHDVEELLRLSRSFNIEEDSIEGTTTEVHDVDMREPLDDDTNMDIDEEIPADFRRRSLSVTADDRPRRQSSSFVPEDENIRSDEAQVTASGSESQPLSPRFEGERSDVIDVDTAHSLFDGDDDVESASTHIEESVSCPGGIPPSRFYASDKKGKRKAEPQSDPVIVAEDAQSPQKGKLKTYSLRKRKAEDDADTQVEVPDDDEVTVLDGRPSTYIFTMDSLGSRHPRVISVLGNYLRLEAIDKKGIEATSKPFGKQALVPVQPNFCDCGIYLIHFAQTFMSDPTRYCSIITARKGSDNMQKDRKAVWKAEDIGGMRENLRDQLLGLSKEWRVWKSKEKEKDDITMIESSDSEVDIVEVETTPAPSTAGQAKGKTRGGGKGGKRK
ncbi:cysteine proteinase [Armillaria gallica]|uniref:Cysteine proteinase n=1 Tax=Armillaria gallica TaxID=47427 RepID=A0A2H3DRI8_ARMGA|nr:cysteine proteinase [Armillaria gallica]